MKDEAKDYELLFGSNRILNCPHVVEFIGRGINQQVIRFREGEDGVVLFNCKVTDQAGNTLAVVANSKVQHVSEGMHVDVTKDGIKITADKQTLPLLDFAKLGPRQFKLNGIFFLPGYRIVATDEALAINGNSISNCTFASCSAAIGLG